MQRTDAVDELWRKLQVMPEGPVEDSRVKTLLIDAWADLTGSNEESTTAEKLYGRIENLEWKPPFLTFTIERHGATVLGSTKAHLHDWSVDVEAGVASHNRTRFRYVRPRSKPLDVGSLAQDVLVKVLDGKEDGALQWSSDRNTLRVIVGAVIPDSGSKETVAGRRKRFRAALNSKLQAHGWCEVKATRPYTYQKLQSSAS